jgi:hypothetical protein
MASSFADEPRPVNGQFPLPIRVADAEPSRARGAGSVHFQYCGPSENAVARPMPR